MHECGTPVIGRRVAVIISFFGLRGRLAAVGGKPGVSFGLQLQYFKKARVAAQWPAGPQRANDKASVDEFTGTPKSCIRASIVWPLVAGFEPGGGLFWIKPFEEMLTRSTPGLVWQLATGTPEGDRK